MKILKIVKSDVLKQDLSYFTNANLPNWLHRDGEHYRLLSYLVNKFDNTTVIDAGTYQGWSALAMAQNPSNKVLSYDIVPLSFDFLKSYVNVELIQKDINNEDASFILNAYLIMLDVDPHDGIQEKLFIQKLIDINYTGYVLCDDIFLNDQMTAWWKSISLPKYDLTDVGHMHGTGLICFNTVIIIE